MKFERGKVQLLIKLYKNIIPISYTIYLLGSVYTQYKQLVDGKQ